MNENKALDQLARIAYALECMNEKLDHLEEISKKLDALEELPETLEQITDCVGTFPPSRFAPPGTPGASFIRIGGSIYRE